MLRRLKRKVDLRDLLAVSVEAAVLGGKEVRHSLCHTIYIMQMLSLLLSENNYQ